MIKAYCEKVWIYYDEPLFFLLHGEDELEKYACMKVDEELFLCWEVTQEGIERYEADESLLRSWFEGASRFFTTTYRTDDGSYLLEHIDAKDIKREWWPGEDGPERIAPDKRTLEVDEGLFEMLLNCIANLNFIGEAPPEVQEEWRRVTDEKWNQGMKLLSEYRESVRDGEE